MRGGRPVAEASTAPAAPVGGVPDPEGAMGPVAGDGQEEMGNSGDIK